jgi:hypothetical protein
MCFFLAVIKNFKFSTSRVIHKELDTIDFFFVNRLIYVVIKSENFSTTNLYFELSI